MDLIISLILFGILVDLVLMLVTEPLTGRARPAAQDSQVLSSLLAERDRVLTILKELDFDASLGKIPAETYPAQRLSLVQQGAEVLRKIDQLPPVREAVTSLPASKEDPVEAFLTARRTRLSAGTAKNEDKMESLVAGHRKNRAKEAAMVCPQCGNPLASSDRFCPACGRPVQ